MKTFGIYLSYPPKVDLQAQGLGRYLAEFLKEAKTRADARFVISCPSWMRKSLRELFESAGIPPDSFEIIGPKQIPTLLRIYDGYKAYRAYRLRRRVRRHRLSDRLRRLRTSIASFVERTLATTRSSVVVALLLSLGAIVLLFSFIVRSLVRLIGSFSALIGFQRILRQSRSRFSNVAGALIAKPQDSAITMRLYRFMEEAEARLVCEQINKRKEISAWYAPTAFWPHFNDIAAPRLTCVPDVVLSEFPVAYSAVNEDRFLEAFKLVEKAIKGGDRFVTYSVETKNRTMIERYRIPPQATTVIPHGANRLDDLIRVSGFPGSEDATDLFSSNLFSVALNKAIGTANPARFYSGDVKFIFYASQFRPNKNVLSLLRAYDHLLKRRYRGHKLILTGNPNHLPEIAEFIRDHHLQNDVLCLHGLSDRELAACYRLADLAVNPSLSEGGCPFTLTEALSVGTPVVMARIAVTEEVVTDPELQGLMFFDAYNWRDIALRIEWALDNKKALLERQLVLYEKLSRRSWSNVVDEYISLLDEISTRSPLDAERV